ncbi:hypothetical protein [Microbacterium halotolerans]|uniref:hypothetical protein n=1 Tax=Microbacterium halotolerans TaxID=246613 RepID=UPI000E6AB177|nr:hypothetical protein [Microbacterium halotolerans]
MRLGIAIAVTIANGILGAPTPGISLSAGCPITGPTDTCDVNNTGTDVTIDGTHDTTVDTPDPPPPPPPTNDGTGGGGDGTGGDDTDTEVVYDPRCEWHPGVQRPDFCFDTDDDTEDEDVEDDPEPPTVVTATQVLSFAPPTPSVASEPDGVAIVGMPMNVVVPVAGGSSSGNLLGFPVTVHFTPELLALDYGDGTSVEVTAESATWDSLGQAEFTATPTSHAYQQRGTYTITARVLSSAYVDFGRYGTVPVTGLVTSPASTTSVRAVTADTALVDRTCAENPTGPGC